MTTHLKNTMSLSKGHRFGRCEGALSLAGATLAPGARAAMVRKCRGVYIELVEMLRMTFLR